jgi:hypothetical protein
MELTSSSTRAVATNSARAVTNIGELFAALAVGWQSESPDNRLLIAGEGGQFIRVGPRRYLGEYFKPWPGDIVVDSGSYSMRGFIRFEIYSDFRELFTTNHAGDHVWYSAALTARGFELAQAGLLPELSRLDHPFFNPAITDVASDLQLGMAAKRIAQ